MPTPSLLLPLILLAAGESQSPPASLLRYPDLGKDEIVFSFAGELWRVPKSGGEATPVAAPPSAAGFPKFSPDGSTIAFVGDYDGSRELYTIPTVGGVPFQVTHHPAGETLNEWTSDGRLLFTAGGMGVYPRATELYTVPATGGLPEPLPVPYGANGTIDRTGTWLAYTLHSVDTRTWKRYRGGMATDIWIYNLKTGESRQATTWEGVDTIPMWHGDKLYYLSDEGESARSNIWRYDPASGQRSQVTRYQDFDLKWPSVGPDDGTSGEIVYQHGAELVVLNLMGNTTRVVNVRIPGNRPELAREDTNVSSQLGSWNTGPGAKRAIVEAHGDIFTLPAEHGTPRNLTNTSGVAERYPTWSPDGTWMAWFDDSASDGYDLYVAEAETLANRRRLTTDGLFKQEMNWSPDSRQIAYTDKTGTLYVVDVESAERTQIGKERWEEDIPLPSWSHDSSWLAWTQTLPAHPFHGVFVRDMESGDVHQVSSGQFPAGHPAFDRKGEWLYAATDQSFNVTYSSLDTTWIYGESEVLVAFPLRADVKNPTAVESDEEKVEKPKAKEEPKTEEEPKAEPTGEPTDKSKEDARESPADAPKDAGEAAPPAGEQKPEDAKPGRKGFVIDFEGLESRGIRLPPANGSFGSLAVNEKGALIFARRSGGEGGIRLFDIESWDGGEKKVCEGGSFEMTPDGKSILIGRQGSVAYAKASAGAAPKNVQNQPMLASIDPRQEWKQVMRDCWVVYRDWFYDPSMHKVDWNGLRDQYLNLVNDCNTRADLSFLISEFISELNVGHAYYNGSAGGRRGRGNGGGGDGTGMLGVDWELATEDVDGTTHSAWRIKRIYEGSAAEVDARNPLRALGVNIKEGTCVLAVDHAPLRTDIDPWAGFQNLAGKTCVLTVNEKPFADGQERKVPITCLGSESDLRYRSWVEMNRAFVEKMSDGKVGYIYVPNTGTDGQTDLVRQSLAARGTQAVIVDDRWNGGGQIPTRFIELLDRPVTNFWARRDSDPWVWPPDGIFGPKCMLINGLAGSGGDMFPWLFKNSKLGPLVGTRTWGGLVGISGTPQFVDGTSVSVPQFAFYETDGTWGIEGHGVDPDVAVLDDPSVMKGGIARGGTDPQLAKAVDLMLQSIQQHPFKVTPVPAYPDRKGMGIPPSDR